MIETLPLLPTTSLAQPSSYSLLLLDFTSISGQGIGPFGRPPSNNVSPHSIVIEMDRKRLASAVFMIGSSSFAPTQGMQSAPQRRVPCAILCLEQEDTRPPRSPTSASLAIYVDTGQ